MKTAYHFSKGLALALVLFSSLTLASPIPSDKDVLLSLGNPTQNSLPRKMNILVWNLHKGSNQSFSTDFMELSYQKDLVIAQEMLLDNLMRLVFAVSPFDTYTTATSFFLGKKNFRTGVATGGDVSPLDSKFIRTETLEPIVNSPKITLITRYPIRATTKQLTVVNIHGINFVDGSSYRKEMNRIYEALKNTPSPMIFTGDFNTWNDDRNEILREVCDKLRMKEAKFSPDNRMRFRKHPLDHFFYTDDLRVVEAKVEDFYQGSDHRPLELAIEYTPSLELKLTKKH